MKTYILRGSFANEFELQNYTPLREEFGLKVITSKDPISIPTLPRIELSSPYDLSSLPFKNAIISRIMTDPHWLIGLEEEIEGADIIHTAETYYGYTHQAVEMKKSGLIKNLVSTCWETIPHNNESVGSRKKWKEDAYRYIDTFITPTEKAKSALIKEGVDPGKITVIRVGVDIDRFTPTKPSDNVRRVLFVGRFVPEKGIEDVIKVARKFPDIHFRFIGSGPTLPYGLNTSVARSDYQSIHKEYQEADILIAPSKSTDTWEEQYGMVLVEAMASGLPIITTDSGAIREVVGKAAIISDSDKDALIYSLSDLINRTDKRHELSNLSRDRALNHFDKNKISLEIANLYNSLIT